MDELKSSAPLDCAEVVRNLWEYLDRRASPDLVGAIDDHLALCAGCRAHFDFERRLVNNLAGLRGRYSDPDRLRNEVLEILRSAGIDES